MGPPVAAVIGASPVEGVEGVETVESFPNICSNKELIFSRKPVSLDVLSSFESLVNPVPSNQLGVGLVLLRSSALSVTGAEVSLKKLLNQLRFSSSEPTLPLLWSIGI